MITAKKLISVLSPVLLLVGFGVSLQAQNRQKYVISAKAGTVNSVRGRVSVQRSSTASLEVLAATDDLNSGDVVQTGSSGRVEVLLSPGSYLRVGENSEFELSNSSLDALRIKLIKGESIFEVTGPSETSVEIGIDTPRSELTIVKRGIYRINVPSEKRTEMLVRKGRILVGPTRKPNVDSGHELILDADSSGLAKLDKSAQDDFDTWSKDRAKILSEANRSLTDSRHSDLLASATRYNSGWGLYDRYSSYYSNYGLWFFDPFLSCFTFAPFYSGWGSPYGFGYYNNFFGLPLTRYYFGRGPYARVIPPFSRSGGAGAGGGTHSRPSAVSSAGGGRRMSQPYPNNRQRSINTPRPSASSSSAGGRPAGKRP